MTQSSENTRIPANPAAAPIFITANGRSGTTLMRYLLNAHPNIYIAEEICFHFWMAVLFGNFRRRLYQYFQSFSYAWLRMDPQVVLDALPKQLDKRDFAAVYTKILQCKAAQYGKKRFGEKGPVLILSLDQLFRDYPDARVIYMVRDPRSVVHSHTTMPWSTASLIQANIIVRDSMRTFRSHGDRVLSVKLEELVAHTEPVMRKVLDFVGEEWSDQVLHHTDYLIPDEGIPFPWLAEASQRPKQKTLSWQQALSPAWIRIIEKTNRETLDAFGYTPLDLPQEPTHWQKLCAVIADLPNLALLGLHAIRVFTLLMVTPKSNARKIQMLMHSTNPGAWKQHPEWDAVLPEPPPVNPPKQLLQ